MIGVHLIEATILWRGGFGGRGGARWTGGVAGFGPICLIFSISQTATEGGSLVRGGVAANVGT